jgi:chromosome segregation and condensation protein ScpB
MSQEKLKNILEAAMLAAQRPLSVDDLSSLFEGSD